MVEVSDTYRPPIISSNMPLAHWYDSPKEWIFLDANSVGPVPATAEKKALNMIKDWANIRSMGWEDEDWIVKPNLLGNMLAPLIGAAENEVIVCDNTTTNLFKAMGHALAINHNRHKVLTHRDNFPTDHHVLQGLAQSRERPLEIVYVTTMKQAIEALESSTEQFAFCTFSHVDYKYSQRWDMQLVNQAAQKNGALNIWDVSHSAGTIPIDVKDSDADYLVGCGYKYLSLGPGGPAFLYVKPSLITKAWPAMCGWMGHEKIADFSDTFIPSSTINRFATSTQTVAANQLASCAAEIFIRCDSNDIWAHHRLLSTHLVTGLQKLKYLGVELLSPIDYQQRGGHVSFSVAEGARVCTALKRAKVAASFRQPNFLRFGLSPMTLSIQDIDEALQRLQNILLNKDY
ncbi:MAG: aminotransferase class V-fold PLP-dependent enzyme [Oceanospirillaceae bacterium]